MIVDRSDKFYVLIYYVLSSADLKKCTVSKNAFNSIFMQTSSTMPKLLFQLRPFLPLSHTLACLVAEVMLLLFILSAFLFFALWWLPSSLLSFSCLLAFAASHLLPFENRKANRQDMMGRLLVAVQLLFLLHGSLVGIINILQTSEASSPKQSQNTYLVASSGHVNVFLLTYTVFPLLSYRLNVYRANLCPYLLSSLAFMKKGKLWNVFNAFISDCCLWLISESQLVTLDRPTLIVFNFTCCFNTC